MTKTQQMSVLALLTVLLAGCTIGGGQSQPASEESSGAASAEASQATTSAAGGAHSSGGDKAPEMAASAAPEAPKVLDNITLHKPFIVASESEGTLEVSTREVRSALQAAGFEIAGQYAPMDDTNVIVVTNDLLKAIAARSPRGGYAAGQRVSITETDGTVEVGFMNPVYIQYAYRLNGDMRPVYDSLVNALGMVRTCGAGKKKMTAQKLDKYHYMMGMQYFDDVSKLGSFDSHEAAVAAVEQGLAKPGDSLTWVYRIDVPGTAQTVFGVGMKLSDSDTKDLDDAFQMSVVDFEGCKKRAYFPYEVLVKGSDVEALHMRFRMAVHFPNLSMMGSHGFTKLVSAPGVIETALKDLVNGE